MDEDQPDRLKPTKPNIMRELQALVAGAKAGDALFFGFSGQGTQVDDQDGDEKDGKDEAILAVDGQPIIDDVLFDTLVKSLPVDSRLTVLVDCSHAGTILDLPYTTTIGHAWRSPNPNPPVNVGTVLSISACKDKQVTVDAGRGTSTATGVGVSSFLTEFAKEIQTQSLTQRPVLSCTHALKATEVFSLSPFQDPLKPLRATAERGKVNPYISLIQPDAYAADKTRVAGARAK